MSGRVVSGLRHHRSRMLVGHLMCRDEKSEGSFLERRAVRTLAVRRNYQTTLGSFLKCVQKRIHPLVEDAKFTVPYSNDCVLSGVQDHHDSAMDRWLLFSRFLFQKTSKVLPVFERMATAHAGAYPSSNASTCFGRQCSTAHPSQPSSHGSFHSHFVGDLQASVRASGIEKERSCPTATSPLLVGRDRRSQDPTGARVQNFARCSTKRSMESFQQCRKI